MINNNLFRNSYFSNGIITLAFFHIVVITIFFFYRLVLSYLYFDDIIYPELILKSVLIGVRLDLIISSFLSLPILFTIFFPILNDKNKIYKFFIKIFSLFVFSFIIIFCSIDLEWFKEFNHHLNIMFIYYGAEGKEGWLHALKEYNLIFYISFWILTVFISFKSFSIYKFFIKVRNSSILLNILNFLISLIFTVVLFRGGFQERPLDWGYAHYSNDNMLNEIAQNPVFFFSRSIIEMRSEKIYKTFLKSDNYKEIQNEYSNLVKQNSKDNIDIKIDNKKRPNIVLIIMESFISENCNFLNPNLQENITPFLSKLEKKSISFTKCLANGRRSAHGLSSILTSYPALPGMPLISQVESSNQKSVLHYPMNILTNIGYKKIFLYGGDGNFDNLKGFAKTNGFSDFIDWNDERLSYINDGTTWGLYDHHVLNEMINIIDHNVDRPLLLTFFSTTNHDPFKVPDEYDKYFKDISTGNKKYQKAKKTMAYNDLVLEQFFNKIKNKSWYDNTIFIITADHGLTVSRSIPGHPLNGHIPFIIHSSLIQSSIKIDKVVSQIDILPTLYDLMDLDTNLQKLYGISGLKGGDGFAFRVIDKNLQWLTPDKLFSQIMNTEQSKLYKYESLNNDFILKNNLEENKKYDKNINNYISNAFYQIKKNKFKY